MVDKIRKGIIMRCPRCKGDLYYIDSDPKDRVKEKYLKCDDCDTIYYPSIMENKKLIEVSKDIDNLK